MSDPEISSRLVTSVVLRYGLAVVSVAIALGLALLAQVYAVQNPEFPLFLIAIAVTVWYAGAWPGVLAVVLSSASFNYFFTEPLYTFYIAPSDRLLRSMAWRCCSRLNLMRN
jgi:K+-sensing histidine kinase KdpD